MGAGKPRKEYLRMKKEREIEEGTQKTLESKEKKEVEKSEQ